MSYSLLRDNEIQFWLDALPHMKDHVIRDMRFKELGKTLLAEREAIRDIISASLMGGSLDALAEAIRRGEALIDIKTIVG